MSTMKSVTTISFSEDITDETEGKQASLWSLLLFVDFDSRYR